MDGLELKLKRIRLGLTLYDLGQKSGVHPSRISEMERDQRAIAVAVVATLDGLLDSALEMAETREARGA